MDVANDNRDKLAFASHDGLSWSTLMQCGLKSAPGTLHRTKDIILSSVKRQLPLVYLRDIVLLLKSAEGAHWPRVKGFHEVSESWSNAEIKERRSFHK